MEKPIYSEHQINKELEVAMNHCRTNYVKAEAGRKCVDGRYKTETGMIARPGGDFGYVMALLTVNQEKNLGLTPDECAQIVFDTVTKDDGVFYMHTDHHADPDPEEAQAHSRNHGHPKPLIGCGHIAKAADPNNTDYRVAAPDVTAALTSIKNLQNKPETQDKLTIVNLEGDHKEQGVLVVEGQNHSVKPYDVATDSMYFIYDATRDAQFLKQIVAPGIHSFDKVNNAISTEELYTAMEQASAQQLQATLRHLAPGKAVFHVNAEGENPIVAFAGYVETPQS